jgi:hypothetical protein
MVADEVEALPPRRGEGGDHLSPDAALAAQAEFVGPDFPAGIAVQLAAVASLSHRRRRPPVPSPLLPLLLLLDLREDRYRRPRRFSGSVSAHPARVEPGPALPGRPKQSGHQAGVQVSGGRSPAQAMGFQERGCSAELSKGDTEVLPFTLVLPPEVAALPAGVGSSRRWQRSMKCSWAADCSFRSTPRHLRINSSAVVIPSTQVPQTPACNWATYDVSRRLSGSVLLRRPGVRLQQAHDGTPSKITSPVTFTEPLHAHRLCPAHRSLFDAPQAVVSFCVPRPDAIRRITARRRASPEGAQRSGAARSRA